MDDKLTSEQILCLQWLGYQPMEIIRADQSFFCRQIEERGEAEEMLDKAMRLLDRQRGMGIRTIPFHDIAFPVGLRRIGDDCPPLIHLLGNVELLDREAVAIIGARQADKWGCEAAYTLGAEYAGKGDVIISGLALGCDAAAHRGCLDAWGNTIAIVATGLDRTHPKEHKPLQDLILAREGLLLSEQPIGVKANPTRLIARNRLQAALAQKVMVAQCPLASGTMHTVRFAQKYGKSIYAVSSRRYEEKNSGNKYLLEEGIAMPL